MFQLRPSLGAIRSVLFAGAVLGAALAINPACAPDASPEASGRREGTVEVSIANLLDGSTVESDVLVTDAGERFELRFQAPVALATGDRIVVFGVEFEHHAIRVDRFEPVHSVDETARGALTGNAVRTTSRLAVLLINWTAPDTQTAATMRDKVFTSPTSTRAFYLENSYGLYSLEGDAFGWFNVAAPTDCSTAQIQALATRARDAAAASGVNVGAYTQFLYYFPRTTMCSWSGLAFLGTPRSPARDTYYNGSSGCVVLAQELLHNFGARHSHSYRCAVDGAGVSLAPPTSCTASEYGDPFDPMGGGCYHVNVYQKAAQAWFGGCNNVNVTSSGTFDLVPHESASNSPQSLRVPAPSSLCPSEISSCYYYIEYRQPLGLFDSRTPTSPVFSGVEIHLGGSVDFVGGTRPAGTFLLDMTPTTTTFTDNVLTVGRTFQDPAGLAITLVSASAASARVSVQIPNGTGAPTCIGGGPFNGGSGGTGGASGTGGAGGTGGASGTGGAGGTGGAAGTSGTGGAGGSGSTPCAVGETAFGGHCYVLTSAVQTYDNALAACRARGTGWSLAEIASAAENSFVSSLAGTTESWLGGNDRTTEGRWVWQSTAAQFWQGAATGFAVGGAFTNWTSDEPNDAGGADCLRMIGGGAWRDISCSNAFRAACER